MAVQGKRIRMRKLREGGSDTRQDTRMGQLHLTPGSAGYEALVRENAGIDEADYIADDMHISAGDDKRPDELQEPVTEPEHVATLAKTLRETNKQATAVGRKVGYTKYRSHILKEFQNGDLDSRALDMALLTPSKEDDIRAKHFSKTPGVRDLVHNDGVVQDEYVPRALDLFDLD